MTSKATVMLASLKRMKQAVSQLPCGASERWVAVVPVGRRFDILSCLHEQIKTDFKDNNNFVVQCIGSETQSSRQLPTFVIVSQAKLCQQEKVPCSFAMNSVRAKSWECLRQRCLNPNCQLRDSGSLEEDVPKDEQEKDGDCQDVQEDDEEDASAAAPKEEVADPESVPDSLKKELYPFTRPVEQGLGLNLACNVKYKQSASQQKNPIPTCLRGKRLLTGICHAATASRVVVMTRTAHPGLLVAGRMLRLRVHAFFDSTRFIAKGMGSESSLHILWAKCFIICSSKTRRH